ncbi:hypothetical protein [Abiotrophia defectiva]|nr:hypothetical protein [Abiotrophia defectiva]MCY7225581.1 hypothetical protein [Abiotrophia defectiva]
MFLAEKGTHERAVITNQLVLISHLMVISSTSQINQLFPLERLVLGLG